MEKIITDKDLILAFESSAKTASVALCRGKSILALYTQTSGLTHSQTLLPMAEHVLESTKTKISDIDIFAVTHGPGSFTGIRIGVSCVKGLCWANEKACIGISSLEALAYNAINYPEGTLISAVMDARRNEVYNALFEIRNSEIIRLCEDRPISIADLGDELLSLEREVLFIGDGADLCYGQLKDKIPAKVASGSLKLQSAESVALASLNKTAYSAKDLTPVYLRLSQAERERNERLKREENNNI